MCRSARAGVAASSGSNSKTGSVMRIDRSRAEKYLGTRAKPAARPEGRTLAGLCWELVKHPDRAEKWQAIERDDFSSNRHLALSFCLSMIFSENQCPLFRVML